MANTDNECKDLEYKEIKHSKAFVKGFNKIFKKQKELQERLGFNFENMTLKEISDYLIKNKHAYDDEHCEMLDALGGIKDGIGNSIWKHWKKDHKKSKNMKVKDLSNDDLKELYFEFVDKFHFFINEALAIGITPELMYKMYMSKNKENHKRQDRGY